MGKDGNMQTRVAVMSIILHDCARAGEVKPCCTPTTNTSSGRMGLPYRQKGIYIISVAVDAPQDAISALSGKIGRLPGREHQDRLFGLCQRWQRLKRLVDRLAAERGLPEKDMLALLACGDGEALSHLFARARAAREAVYGRDVYIRGLIEFTNFCKNDCLYCGIRRSNARACRYRLSEEEILLWPRRATAWASARWCCRAGRIPISPTSGSAASCGR